MTTTFYADDPRTEPEPTPETCDLCNHAPCSCDEEFESYRDRQMED